MFEIMKWNKILIYVFLMVIFMIIGNIFFFCIDDFEKLNISNI